MISLIGATALLSLFVSGFDHEVQTPLFLTGRYHQQSKPILDDEFETWLNKIGCRWGMKGISIAVTRHTRDENGNRSGWETEMKGYGVADRWILW